MSAVPKENRSTVVPSKKIIADARRNVEIEELDAAIGKLTRQMNANNYQLMVMLRSFLQRTLKRIVGSVKTLVAHLRE